MKKAIKIDVEKQSVYEIEIGDDFREIYPHIGNGCSLFTVPVQFENGDSLYADDEGLLHQEMIGGFIMENWRCPIVGNAIILGTDDEGDSIDYKSNIPDIEKRIDWLSKSQAELYKKVMGI